MITYEALNNKISDIRIYGGDLNTLTEEWSANLDKVSAFIDMFLDTYGNRVIGDKTNSPEWKLYSAKTQEYNIYNQAIRNAQYFIAKEKLQNG